MQKGGIHSRLLCRVQSPRGVTLSSSSMVTRVLVLMPIQRAAALMRCGRMGSMADRWLSLLTTTRQRTSPPNGARPASSVPETVPEADPAGGRGVTGVRPLLAGVRLGTGNGGAYGGRV